MARPGHALRFSVLRKRWKKRKLPGRHFRSEVVTLLNKPLTKSEAPGTKQRLLGEQAFWHDLRLLCAFDEPKTLGRDPMTKRKARVVVFD
jgi:hypothetical protein